MPKIPIDKLEPGMKLSKPLVSRGGMVLLGDGTELTEKWIDRIQDMEVDGIYVDGPSEQKESKEESLAKLDARFLSVEKEPYMGRLKRIVRDYIEALYGEH
ncbi:MAG: hypothetical protein JW950_05120 [Deltaproteobacteria bacterium]|nr:hypothetical protein [Deltaproteobacteria bacterium]